MTGAGWKNWKVEPPALGSFRANRRFDRLRLSFDPFGRLRTSSGLRVVSVVEPLNALSLAKGISQSRASTVGAGVELACLVEVGERVTRFRFDSFGDVAR